MKSKKYTKEAVGTIKYFLYEDYRELKGVNMVHSGPSPPGYLPELDATK